MKLPVGVYVVCAAFEGQTDTVHFVFKGMQYEAQMGINAFCTLEGLIGASLTCPTAPFCGYADTPVALIPSGTYKMGLIKETRKRTLMPCAITLLGENAGISPNAEDLRTPNPLWQNDSILEGSFYFGTLGMQSNAAGVLTLDGLTLQNSKVWDERTEGTGHGLILRNCVFQGYQSHDLVKIMPLSDPEATRFTTLSDIRADGIDDMDDEGRFLAVSCGDLTVERLYFANNKKFIGLTNFRRATENGRPGESNCLTFRSCLFEHCQGPRGLDIHLPENAGNVSVCLEDCQFHHSAPENVPAINVDLPHSGCRFRAVNCQFQGAGATAIQLNGSQDADVAFTDSKAEGFSSLWMYKAPRRTAPQANPLPADDPHIPIPDADFAPLDALYAGRAPYHGDFHVHTNSGGTSDGRTPLGEFVEQLKSLEMDFAAVVDHRQMRHFFLPEWDETMLICGTEPSTRLKGRSSHGAKMDYTMIFPDKDGLARVMEAFPEFEYTGGTEGHYIYASHTPERLMELGEFIWNMGGLMTHAHPKQLMVSRNPMDYYFGEHVPLETVHGNPAGYGTKQNRDLWVALLQQGKRVRTHGSSDTHKAAMNAAQTTVYAPRHHSKDIFEQVRKGDCTAGAVGIQMAIDGCVMGGSTAYRPGQTLLIRVADPHPVAVTKDTVWCLKVYTDKGLACAREFDGTFPFTLALPVKDRSYYRAELINESDDEIIAISNPIWLD